MNKQFTCLLISLFLLAVCTEVSGVSLQKSDWQPQGMSSPVIFYRSNRWAQTNLRSPSSIHTYWYCWITNEVYEGRPNPSFYHNLNKPAVCIVKDGYVTDIKGYKQKWINALLSVTGQLGYKNAFSQ